MKPPRRRANEAERPSKAYFSNEGVANPLFHKRARVKRKKEELVGGGRKATAFQSSSAKFLIGAEEAYGD